MATVHDAARRNDVEALRRLLDEDPGLVEKEEWQGTRNTPLHSACRYGREILWRGTRKWRRCLYPDSPSLFSNTCCATADHYD